MYFSKRENIMFHYYGRYTAAHTYIEANNTNTVTVVVVLACRMRPPHKRNNVFAISKCVTRTNLFVMQTSRLTNDNKVYIARLRSQ